MKIPSQLRIALKKLIFEIRIRFYPILHRFRTWTRKAYQAYRQSEPDWLSIDFHTSASFNSRCLCISLVEDPRFDNRRVFFQKYAERFGWPFAFWPATNGGCLKEIPLWINQGRRPSHPAPLSRGEIGLLITTKALYEWTLEQELDFLVVFEDDAAIHMAPRLELPQKFDFVFFNNRFSGDLQGRLKSGWGADGYVVSKEGIRKMLAIMQADVGEPLDLLIMMYARSLEARKHYITNFRSPNRPQLDCFHVGPAVTHAGFFDSTIGLVSRDNQQ